MTYEEMEQWEFGYVQRRLVHWIWDIGMHKIPLYY